MRLAHRRGLVAALVAPLLLAGGLIAPAPATAAPPPVPTEVTPAATTTTVYYWNDVLLETFRRHGGGPGPLARAAAMMHVGIFHAFNTADWSRRGWLGTGYHWYQWLPHPEGTYFNDDIAAGVVARALLIDAFPDQSAFIHQAYVTRHGTGTPPADAVSLSGQVVDHLRGLRAGDGSGDTTPYPFENQPGAWQLTGPTCSSPTDAVTPNWGRVRPFSQATITPYVQDLPGGHTNYADLLASDLYANVFNEVKELGRFDSTVRTAEQEEIGWFWANDLDGTYKPIGQLLDYTRVVAQQRGITRGLDLSRLFAWVSLALADAGIAAWHQKYDTPIDLWRPQTAIQQAATDGNPDTDSDPGWLPLSADRPPSTTRINPCFPAWVSGHATFAAAWAGVLRNEFGDSTSLTVDSEDPRAVGVQRSFSSFTQAAVENARSRIYLGVHYQFDADDGLATGFSVADHVHATFFDQFTCNGQPGQVCW